VFLLLWSFQGARGCTECAQSFKTQQRESDPRSHSRRSLRGDGTSIEVDVVLGETGHRTIRRSSTGRSHPRSKSSEIP